MKDQGGIDWRLVVLGPLGLIVLVVLLVVALGQVTTQAPPPAAPRAWLEPLRSAEDALAEGNLGEAARAAREAYRAALTSGQWPGMIEVGDLHLRLNNAAGTRTTARAQVRKAYFIALVRARREGDLGGVLRAAESFAKLDDDETVEQALRIAAAFAAHGSPETREMYRHTAERLRKRAAAANPLAAPAPSEQREMTSPR